MLGKMEGRRRRGRQRMQCLDGITKSMDKVWGNSRRWWRTGKPGMLQFMGLQRVWHDWAAEQHVEKPNKKRKIKLQHVKLRYSQAYPLKRTFPFSINWKFMHLWQKSMKENCAENSKSRKLSQKCSCFASIFFRWKNWFRESLSISSKLHSETESMLEPESKSFDFKAIFLLFC